MITFTLRGTVRDIRTGKGIAGLYVKACDADQRFDDILGGATTGPDGRFEIVSTPVNFRDFFEKGPSIFLKVFEADRSTLLHSTDPMVWNGGMTSRFDIRISYRGSERSARAMSARSRTLRAGGGENDDPEGAIDPGEALVISASELNPATVYEIAVFDSDKKELFTSRLITNGRGDLGPTVIWPQVGLDDLESGETYSVEQARELWGGQTLLVEVRDIESGEVVMEQEVAISTTFDHPLILSTNEDGNVLNGFEVGQNDAIVSMYNFAVPEAYGARVIMVPRQHDWRVGNPIVPAQLEGDAQPVVDVDLDADTTDFTVTVAQASELRPGAYDFIVRPLRYGYENDYPFLRDDDIVSGHHVTGLVVREEFWQSKAVLGGCVNTLDIAGRVLPGEPYMQFTNVFQVGEDVWAALDPKALDPNNISKMVALYLIQHKTPAQWGASSALTHLAVLGGNANTPKFLTQSFCINANMVLIWPNATQVGEYDIVADFGNNTASSTAFVPDDSYDTPLDLIDGYYVPGFRILPDPTTDTSFAHAGNFTYDETTQGSATVLDDFSSPWTVPLRASVYFPADAAGATTPGQISVAQTSYPMVFVVHGNSSATNSYLGYEYLLEHLARNGFIAVSIHLLPGQLATDRARILFEHIDIINNLFGASAANNIGIMGHSRGGEAVVIAAQLNQVNALGYGINAVISLAPTSWIANPTLGGAWAKPYLVVYGSMDGDVAGITDTGFELYDRANGAKKSMVFVYGSTHGRYNTIWGDTDITAGWSQLGPADIPKLVNADAHEKIAKGYMCAFFRQYLKSETQWEGLFKGEWVPVAVQTADGGKVKLYVQYEDTTHREVDNFEGTHTGTSWATSTIGDAVTHAGLPATPQEAQTYPTDTRSPHETGALFLSWDNLTDTLRFDIPVGQRDVTQYEALSFRIGQKAGSALNPAGLAQDLRVTLHDTLGNSRAIRVSKFAVIPPPHDRANSWLTKTAMNTVRIPLRSFTIRCAGIQEVDLTTVDYLRFEFSEKSSGEVVIDSVEFTA